MHPQQLAANTMRLVGMQVLEVFMDLHSVLSLHS